MTVPGFFTHLLSPAINFAVAFLFLSTLRPGKTPLISAIAVMESGGPLPPELASYTRRLTGAWGLFLVLLGGKHLVLEWPQGWWLAAVFLDTAAIASFFVLEFAWRRQRFPDRSFATPWALFMLIRRQGGIFRLYRQCMT